MFQSLLVPHKEITPDQLNEIIQIKSIAWPYSLKKQIEWIHRNLKNTDIHVLLYLEGSLVAYLNLIEIEFTLDGNLKHGYGIGNVCSREKGKGRGKELISVTNSYLIQNGKVGLLFCKDLLVNFYSINNWRKIEKKKITLPFKNESIQTLIFNWGSDIQNLEYRGLPF
jgi:hypothetical protein